MEYAKLKEDGSYDFQIQADKVIEWDASNLCLVSTLTLEQAERFRVAPLIAIPMPDFNPNTHKCFRDGAEFVDNKWHYKWTTVELTEEEIVNLVASAKKSALIQINNDDNKIYADVVGNKTTEYLDAAADAKAFKDAGYPVSTVPKSVQSWADAKLTWTAQQAADDILAQQVAWKAAAEVIREVRLREKEAVKRATTIEEIEAAMFIWNNFVVSIRTQLGVN